MSAAAPVSVSPELRDLLHRVKRLANHGYALETYRAAIINVSDADSCISDVGCALQLQFGELHTLAELAEDALRGMEPIAT